MSKINILPASVYNRIAAGEVVDRPYSVVKELVENAIDAGANEIEIHVEKGGKQLIRVTDNGSGIARDDLQAAFLPHATSKIEKATDLERIMTLGFRGEAVASIASVSKMTITSKTKDGNCYSLSSDGGELGEIIEAAGSDGTDVKVEMLFFNTPVRLGFLKSDKAEETDIINFVSRFILSRPEISFQLYVNGKRVLQSFGGGEEEAMTAVYGASILKNCYRIHAEKHGITVSGYIGNQNFFKPNKTYQSVFLNGRYIVNTTISTAIHNAYSNYLMKRQYPFYVLQISIPPEVVDVNVHPNKADVRFAENQHIFGAIYSIISAVLDGNAKALEYLVEDKNSAWSVRQDSFEDLIGKEDRKPNAEEISFTYEDAKREMQLISPTFKKDKDVKTEKREDLPFDLPPSSKPKAGETYAESYFQRLKTAEKDSATEDRPVFSKLQTQPQDDKESDNPFQKKYSDLFFEENRLRVNTSKKTEETEKDYFAENKKFLEEQEQKAKQNRIDVASCSYAGKLFNTYLLYERGDEFYIIDQHAAHERLIFNKLKEKMEKREIVSQPMLLPYKLDLNAFEFAFIGEHLDSIRAMGFDIDEFGERTYKISAVPMDLQDIDLGKFFNDILCDVSGFKAIKLESLLKDKLASAACKAAVKGGMDLTQEEIAELFRLMDGNMGLKCPHGRPVVARMTKTELEKIFKRIV